MTYTPTLETIDARVREIVAQAVGWGNATSRVIIAEQNGAAPTDPFATVQPMSRAIEGLPWPSGDGAGSIVTLALEYDVQFYCADADARAAWLQGWVLTGVGADFAAARGLSVNAAGPWRDLSEIVSQQWEDRAGVDLRLSTALQLAHAAPAALAPRTESSSVGAFGLDLALEIEV